MIFGPKNKRHKPLHTLTEEGIRDRLYGSAVGMAVDTKETASKKHKSREEKTASTTRRELKDEQIKIQKELELLKRDLECAKRKLYRMRGLRTKKIRLLAAYLTVFLIATTLTAITIKQLVFAPKKATQTVTAQPRMIYSIQVAVYGNGADAQGLSTDLNSRGYEAFIKESRFGSGKERFTVYVGGFKDKKTASEVLDKLRTKEGMGGSFITSMPE